MTTSLISQFIFAAFATFGFTLIFRVPKSDIIVCSLIGAFGWLSYQLAAGYGFSATMACFLGACTVALLSDIASKLLKDAATIFIIPGIMPLVPGAGMYKMMLELIHNDMTGFATEATQTLMAAGAIAVGLLVMGSLLKIIRMTTKKIKEAF